MQKGRLCGQLSVTRLVWWIWGTMVMEENPPLRVTLCVGWVVVDTSRATVTARVCVCERGGGEDNAGVVHALSLSRLCFATQCLRATYLLDVTDSTL
jgi:hypothetical protein